MKAPSNALRGATVRLRNNSFVVVGSAPGGRLKLQHTVRRNHVYLSSDELNRQVLDGNAQVDFVRKATRDDEDQAIEMGSDLSSLPRHEQLLAQKRLHYVREILSRNLPVRTAPVLRRVISEIEAEIDEAIWSGEAEGLRAELARKPSVRSIARWLDAYQKANGDVLSLARFRSGNSEPRLERPVREVIDECISRYYLTPERRSRKWVYRQLLGEIEQRNAVRFGTKLESPSIKAFNRAINRLDAFEVMASRFGREYAKRHFRPYGAGINATRPLEIVQMDHTILDVVCTDLDGKLVLGRPWLTVAIDLYSRCVLSIVIGFEPPSYLTVMECLRGAILPKEAIVERDLCCIKAWDMYGIPGTLLLDNGKEFRSLDLQNAAAHLKISLQYCPPRQPWFKGVVERVIGTLNRALVHNLPGHVVPIGAENGDYKAGEHACIDIGDLRTILTKWIVDIYHQTPHSAIENPPARQWETGSTTWPPLLMHNQQEIRIYLGRSEQRVVHSYGIELFGLYYNSEKLALLRHHIDRKEKVDLKYDPSDIGDIYVLDPIARTYFSVPCIQPGYARGKSVFVHDLIRKRAREECEAVVDWEGLLRAERDIAAFVASLKLSGQSAKKKVARYLSATKDNSTQADGGGGAIPPAAPTQLECKSHDNSDLDRAAAEWADAALHL